MKFFASAVVLIILVVSVHGDYLDVMDEELKYTMDKMSMEGLEQPFYAAYTFRNMDIIKVRSVFGSATSFVHAPFGAVTVCLKVGDYSFSNDNYFSYNNIFSIFRTDRGIPGNPDSDELRRAFWMLSDETYKEGAYLYEEKQNLFSEQGIKQNTDDFTRNIPESFISDDKYEMPGPGDVIKLTDRLSGIFKKYPDIFDSYAEITVIGMKVHYIDSEGSKALYPMGYCTVEIGGSIRDSDNHVIGDRKRLIFKHIPGDEVLRECREVAEKLYEQGKTYDDYYCGPVLFTGSAAARIAATALFGGDAPLIARRIPKYSDERVAMSDPVRNSGKSVKRMGRRVISTMLTVEAVPGLKTYGGVELAGAFFYDAEGQKPRKLRLIKKGITEGLLNSRIPVDDAQENNGHHHWASPWSAVTAPGVFVLSSEKMTDEMKARKEALRISGENGYDYYIEVRRLEYPGFAPGTGTVSGDGGNILVPAECYKVTADGRSTLLRHIDGMEYSMFTLRNVLAAGEKTGQNVEIRIDPFSVPVSVVAPSYLLLDDIVIEGKGDKGKKEKALFNP